MKFFKALKSKLLIVLIIMIACMATISYAEVEPQETLEEVEGDEYEISLTSEDLDSVDTDSNHIEEDLFLFENAVTIDYPVCGNIFVIAGNVKISNQVDGNVFVLAQTVDITSDAYIYGDLFVCADTVNIKGYMYDLYSASSELTILSNAQIFRDITAVADTVNLSGAITRNAKLSFDTINIDEAQAFIGGNLSYNSKSASIPDSIVSGTVTYNETAEDDSEFIVSTTAEDYVKSAIKVLIIALIVVLILVLAIPKFTEKEYQILKNKPAQSLGYGALALFVIPIACFILFCTIIGIIPAIIILLAYILLIQISSAIVAIPLSKILCKKINKESKGMVILMSILIVLAIFILEKLPVLGSLISLVVAMYGLGIITYAIFHAKTEIKDKNVVAEATVVVESKNEESSEKEKNTEKEIKADEDKDSLESESTKSENIDNKKDSEN